MDVEGSYAAAGLELQGHQLQLQGLEGKQRTGLAGKLHHAKDSVQQATVTGQEQYHSGTSHIYSINHLKTADGALQGQVLSKQILLHIATGITVTPNSGIYNFNTKKKKNAQSTQGPVISSPHTQSKTQTVIYTYLFNQHV